MSRSVLDDSVLFGFDQGRAGPSQTKRKRVGTVISAERDDRSTSEEIELQNQSACDSESDSEPESNPLEVSKRC